MVFRIRTIRKLAALGLLSMGLSGCEIVRTPVGPAPSPTTSAPQTSAPLTSSASSKLALSPANGTVGIGHTLSFQASGGVPPYAFSASAGSVSSQTPAGGVSGSLGVLTAPYMAQSIAVTVQDVIGSQAKATVTSVVGTFLTPNDPRFSQQLALKQSSTAHIHADEAWALQTDCSNVPVGVLDTGVSMTHPELAGNIWMNRSEIAGNGVDDDGDGYVDDIHGWNFVAGNNDPTDDHFHGTHVAGTIGALGNNASGIAGICWKAAVVPLKVLDSSGSGSNSDVIVGIHYAMSIGVKVINASFGGGAFDQSFKDVLDLAATNGVVFVAAAGNESNDNDANPSYPANYSSSSVISVAAVDATDVLAGFSNFGATSVLIAAPGVDILSTMPTTQTSAMQTDGLNPAYDFLSGTSMAAPHVAGVATLFKAFDPSQTAASIKSRLLSGADVISGLSGNVAGSKRLNARHTLY